METKNFTVMDYREWEQLVSKTYNISDYSVVASEEWNNDESHEFYIGDKDKIDWSYHDQEKWAETLRGEGRWDTYLIFEHLVADGVLKSGDYIIEVFW